jgi:hypothetical protein
MEAFSDDEVSQNQPQDVRFVRYVSDEFLSEIFPQHFNGR